MDPELREALEYLREVLRDLDRQLERVASSRLSMFNELKADLRHAFLPDQFLASKGLTGNFENPLVQWLHDALRRAREAEGAGR